MAASRKDRWEKADIILKPAGGLLTALAVAGVGFFGSRYLERRQTVDTNVRLYAELMSSRERADSDLRKDMFNSIITSFLRPKEAKDATGQARKSGADLKDFELQVINLELLAYNFHDALDLSPLFRHVGQQIVDAIELADTARNQERQRSLKSLQNRLSQVVKEIIQKQIDVLQTSGAKLDGTVFFDLLKKNPAGIRLFDKVLKLPDRANPERQKVTQTRHFTLEVLEVYPSRQEILVRLTTQAVEKGLPTEDVVDGTFKVGVFDFPMIDNTRLSNNQRCAIVMMSFDDTAADVTLIYFPGSRASLKEKPYYDEVIENLLADINTSR
ncbi:MAG: hypothetical protein HY695_34005 [Deltaproteobacteria bacterium]|nr:hypothetical protein [Deltaproteobacteria bacterium]